jgi:hypothetical protein
MQYSKATNLNKPIQQLLQAYNNLDLILRLYINRPTNKTTIQDFIKELSTKQDT